MPRIAFLVSSARAIDLRESSNHPTGFWLEEALLSYERFVAAGAEVVVITPDGQAPVADPYGLEPIFHYPAEDRDYFHHLNERAAQTLALDGDLILMHDPQPVAVVLHRAGYAEETYHTFSYSPLIGDGGEVEGLFCAVSEETDRVISERRLGALRELARGLAAMFRSFGLDIAQANLEGTRQVLDALNPILVTRYAQLPATRAALDRADATCAELLTRYRDRPLSDLTRPERQRLNTAFGSLVELLAPIAAIADVRRTS